MTGPSEDLAGAATSVTLSPRMTSLNGSPAGNEARVIDALRLRGQASRSELASATGLSRTTVTSLVADLTSRGLVIAFDRGPGTESSPRGRPATHVRLGPAAGVALGIDFGHRHLRVAVADLSCTVLAERCIELDVDVAADTALQAAASMVGEVLGNAGVARDAVVGAGMGLPGPIDRGTGMVGSSVMMPGWVGLDAAAELRRRIDLPVRVENDANLGALAEVAFGAGKGVQDALYVKISSGIGAGVVLDGWLHRGATGIAGELGHVQWLVDGRICRCGNRGCLETVASAPALVELLQAAHPEPLGVRDMLGLADAGDPGARRVINDAGRAVGRVLGDLANTLNPTAVIVGGDLSAAGDPLLEGIREGIDRYAQPAAAEAVDVRLGALGDRAEVLGALVLVIGDLDSVPSASLAALRRVAS